MVGTSQHNLWSGVVYVMLLVWQHNFISDSVRHNSILCVVALIQSFVDVNSCLAVKILAH